MFRLLTKTLAAITLSTALLGAGLGPAQASPTADVSATPIAGSGSASGSGGSGSSLTPLFTVPLGALYIVLCNAEPTTSPLCALIFKIGSGSVEPDPA
ncbi:hypothetical protein ACWELJ_03885 [Nocardia sp. NPDC004582]